MDGVLGSIEVIDDAEVADAQGKTASLVTLQRFARVRIAGERVDTIDKRGQRRMVLASEFLQILGCARINDNAPAT